MTTVSLRGGAFVDAKGRSSRTLMLAPAEASAEWQAKQSHAVDEYRVTQEQGEVTEEVAQLYRLFRVYLLAALGNVQAPLVLDVGCGMSRRVPPYAEGLPGYVGLDPLDASPERDYPFVCGRLEDLADQGHCRGQFDLFVFCTSLDHIENLDAAATAVRTLARPGARAVFWVGLHDTSLVASTVGAAVFRRAVGARPSFVSYAMLAGYALLRAPRTLWRLAQRERRLATGQPLDDLHFSYFTRATLPAALGKFGVVEEVLAIPGSTSVFARCIVE